MKRPRILVADDHTLVAELCKKLLEPEYDVVGVVCDGPALIRTAAELKPDLIIVDIAMPVLNGLDAAQKVKRMLPSVKIIFLTMNSDPELAAEALRRGASGYILKTSAATEVATSVRQVLRGNSYLSSNISKDALDLLRWEQKKFTDERQRLTERQREVLQLLAEGKVMKEVGEKLHMTPRTVAFHKYRIMEILGAKSSADLVKYAVRNHMVAA
jgi:DNA-binding NarL/FixJ family response regulator